LIKKYKPSIAVGFGGYPSLPPMVAAQRANMLTIIHEANAILGKANAYLAPKADRIALSLPNLSSLEEADSVRAIVTGNPVRADIAAYIYMQAGITATLQPFLNDMPEILKNTHLIIARSGASTVSEIAIAGIPAIYIPYPHHADQQQKINAESISKSGGAWVIEEKLLNPESLVAQIKPLMRSPEDLFAAAEAARSCAKPEATRKLGNLVIALIKGWNKEASKPFDYTQGHH